MKGGYVYAIECGGRIKIGFSEKPEHRLSKIASDAPFPCQLLGYWPATLAEELEVQKQFQAVRVHGEWFASTEDLLRFIAERAVPRTGTRKPVLLCGQEVPRGTKLAIADALDMFPGNISQWKRVPAHHVLEVERVTGISRYVWRPDIYGTVPAYEAAT